MKTISSDTSSEAHPKPLSGAQAQRRKFLLTVTPPVVALLLAAGTANYAVSR